MFNFFVLTEKVLMFVLLMIPGYIMGRLKLLDKNAMSGFSEIITKVAMPCLVIVKMLETDISALGATNVIFCILHVPAFLFLMYFISGIMFGKRRVERFCSVFPNCGFLGIPIAVAMFPDNPEVAVYISIWNIFDSVLVLTFGVNILSGEKRKNSIKSVLFKPITISAVAGIALSLLHVGEKFPAAVTYTEYFANLTTPLSMTILGYELSKLSFKEMFLRRELYFTSVMKLCVSPIVALGIILISGFTLGIEVSLSLSAAIFIATGVATASISSALAQDCGEDSSLAAIITVGTTILSVVSMPVMSIVFEMLF